MSEKLKRLSKRTNEIFKYNLEKALKEKYPDAKNDEERVEKIGVSKTSYYEYKKKGFPFLEGLFGFYTPNTTIRSLSSPPSNRSLQSISSSNVSSSTVIR